MHQTSSSVLQVSIDELPSNAAIYRYRDGDFIIIDFNKMAEQTEQIDKQEMIGKKLTEVFPMVKESGLLDVMLHVHESGEQQEHQRSNYEDERISGCRHSRVSRLTNGDIMTLYDDLTKEKALEARYFQNKKHLEKAQEIAHLGSWEWDMKTDDVTWSDEAYRIFGEIPQSFKLTFEHVMSYMTPEYRDGMQKAISNAVENKSNYLFEFKIKRADSEERHLQSSGYALYDNEGSPRSMIGVVLDITERKLLELHNAQSYKKTKAYKDALLKWSQVDYQNAKDAIKQATKISAETLNVEYVSIWIYNQKRTVLHCISRYSLSKRKNIQTVQLDPRRYTNYFQVLEAGNPVVVDDSLNDPITSEFLDEYLKPFNIRSIIDTPILSHGKVIGVVCNEQINTPRHWTSEDVEFTKAIAVNVALTLEIEKRQKLENQLQLLGGILENSVNEVFIFDAKSLYFTYVNHAAKKNIGYTLEELKGMTPVDIKPDYTMESFLKLMEPLQDCSDDHMVFQTLHQRKNGTTYHAEIRIQSIENNGDKQYMVIAHDVTEREKIQLQLQLLAQALEQMDEMVRITDKIGLITYANKALLMHTGYQEEEILGKNVNMFYSGHHDKAFYEDLWNTILSGKIYKGILVNRKKNKEIYYEEETITPIMNSENEVEHFVVTSQDITERYILEEKLQKLATTDALTGIYNRHKTHEELNIEIARATRYNNCSFALVMFDIDHFKAVNDTYGHDRGDYVLKELCRVISEEIRDSDRFGRWGGEEFMLILPELNKEQAIEFSQKLIDRVAMYTFKDLKQITISVGVSIFTGNGTHETLLKRVDNALYQAKAEGRNMLKFQDM